MACTLGRHWSEQSDAQRQRADLRRDRVEHGFVPILIRCGIGAKVKIPVGDPKTPSSITDPTGPSSVLGQRTDLGQPDQPAQPDVRPQGTGLVHGTHPPTADAGVLPGGLRSSVREGVCGRAVRPPARDVRSEDAEVHAGRHLRANPPSQLRRGRQSHALSERRHHRQRSLRLGQYEDARRDRRRAEVAGLDAVRARHQRQRQARRHPGPQATGRPDQGQAGVDGHLRTLSEPADGTIWDRCWASGHRAHQPG